MCDKCYPVCSSGSVAKAPPLSIYMDDATHLLFPVHGSVIRLKGATKEVTAELETYTGAKCIVTVCGGYAFRAESPLLIVSWIGRTDDFLKQMEPTAMFEVMGEFPHGNP